MYNQNPSGQKKQYSMEDNVKYISFGIKDLVKEMQKLNIFLEQLMSQKAGGPPPF